MNGRTAALAGMAVVALVLVWGQSTHGSAQADDAGPSIALNVTGGDSSCDAASEPSGCTVPAGADFTLAVEVIEAPGPGYIGVQSFLIYGGLKYNPTATAEDEFSWPDAAGLIVRSLREVSGTEGFIQHGGATGNTPPFPTSDYEGSLLELSFTCSEEERSFEVVLIPYTDDVTLGAGFKVDATTTASLKPVGQRELDLDGDPATPPEVVGIADTLTIGCGTEPATPGPEPTDVSTPTSGAAPTPSTAGTPSAGASPTTRAAGTATATAGPTDGAALGDAEEGDDDGGVGAPLVIGLVIAGVAAGALALGGAVWYARRRRLT